jgi:hypothetical protein
MFAKFALCQLPFVVWLTASGSCNCEIDPCRLKRFKEEISNGRELKTKQEWLRPISRTTHGGLTFLCIVV